jgi:hypothetical protein
MRMPQHAEQDRARSPPPQPTRPHVDEPVIGLEDELALPPSQQASSSRAPPPRAPHPPVPAVNAEDDMEVDPLPFASVFCTPEFTPEAASHEARSLSSFLVSQTAEQCAQYLAHLSSVLELAKQSEDVEMPPTDRKGKGKAKE